MDYFTSALVPAQLQVYYSVNFFSFPPFPMKLMLEKQHARCKLSVLEKRTTLIWFQLVTIVQIFARFHFIILIKRNFNLEMIFGRLWYSIFSPPGSYLSEALIILFIMNSSQSSTTYFPMEVLQSTMDHVLHMSCISLMD